jgi:hypothetical protein
MFLLPGELVEDLLPAGILRDARGPRIELEPAALGGNRNPERVTREQELRGGSLLGRRPTGAAGLARPVDLDDALARREAAGGGDLLDERFDVRAEELVRAVAALADQVEVARMPVRVLEPESPLAEIDLAGNARFHHPLQGAVDGGAADPLILALDHLDEIVGAEVPLLAEEHVDDQVALSRALGPGGPQPVEIGNGRRCGHCPLPFLTCLARYELNDWPQPQVDVAFGFLIVKPPPVMVSTKSTSAPFR